MSDNKEKTTFKDLELNEKLLKTVKEMGFESPSAIQEKVIPHILDGVDVIAQAKTGSGKTAAFGLPALNLIDGQKDIGMLVITPTRELCMQVCEELNRFGARSKFEALAVYGGQSVSIQTNKIRQGVQAIVATPGRLLDLLKSKRLKNFSPSIVVLDEADEMLDMGFLEDIQAIFSFITEGHQTLLFSATMPKPIQNFANKFLKNPVTINVIQGKKEHSDISEQYYLTKEKDKELALVRLFDSLRPTKSIIFCKTKRDVDQLNTTLVSLGYASNCLHGDMGQREREQAIKAFKDGVSKVLVATDVAGRGLNVLDITHVINYHIPFSSDSYTHRIGRTGRAGRKGTAISLLSPAEFRQISRMRGLKKEKMDIRPLPTLSELKEKQQEDLVKSVISKEKHKNSEKLLNQLKEEMDLEKIALNLLSMLVEKKELTGPETLGMKLEEINDDRSQKRRSGRKSFNPRSFRGNSSGSSRPKTSSRNKSFSGKKFSKSSR